MLTSRERETERERERAREREREIALECTGIFRTSSLSS